MNVLITGASGLVATELTVALMNNTDHQLFLISRNPKNLINRYKEFGDRIHCLSLDDMLNESTLKIDVCVHTAFARNSDGAEIAKSIELSKIFSEWAKRENVKRFINISSQSVYGGNYEPFVSESSQVSPDYLYAVAKYSSELICESILQNSITELVNIRLASVCENARFIKVFVQNLLENQPIELTAPNQYVSFIDVRDVADALLKVIEYTETISGTFNLGTGKNYSIYDVAQTTVEIGRSRYDLQSPTILIKDNGSDNKIGMDVSKFTEKFLWASNYNMKEMIDSIFQELINVNGGGYPISFKIVYGL